MSVNCIARVDGRLADDWFQTPPLRRPDPDALIAVDAIRGRVAQLAQAQRDSYARYEREQRIRRICEREWDSPVVRRVVGEILAVLDGK